MQSVSESPIEDLTSHIFRHNYCTNLCYQFPKISIKMIARLVGDSEKVVLEVYNHLMLEKEDSISAVNDALNLERKMEQTEEKVKETCEKSNKKAINECFERLWKQYPNKRGKGQVSDTKKKVLYQIGEEHIQRALKRYLDGLEKDASWRKPQNGSTFFNSGYVDYLDENYEKPQEPKPQRNPASVLECERDYDFDSLEMQLMQKQLE